MSAGLFGTQQRWNSANAEFRIKLHCDYKSSLNISYLLVQEKLGEGRRWEIPQNLLGSQYLTANEGAEVESVRNYASTKRPEPEIE